MPEWDKVEKAVREEYGVSEWEKVEMAVRVLDREGLELDEGDGVVGGDGMKVSVPTMVGEEVLEAEREGEWVEEGL